MFSYHTSRHSVLLFIDSELENAASFSGLHLPRRDWLFHWLRWRLHGPHSTEASGFPMLTLFPWAAFVDGMPQRSLDHCSRRRSV
jgi:hypothetical protein